MPADDTEIDMILHIFPVPKSTVGRVISVGEFLLTLCVAITVLIVFPVNVGGIIISILIL